MNLERWRGVVKQALWSLEHADQLPPRDVTRGMALQLRLWRYPRSGPHVSWSVILPVRDYRVSRGVVREVHWDRVADWKRRTAAFEDLKRRQDIEPSLRLRDSEVTWDALSPFLDVVGGLRSPMPLDGRPELSVQDAFGLEGYRSIAHIQLRWSGKGPRGWGDTIAWIGRLRTLLVRTMTERNTEATQR